MEAPAGSDFSNQGLHVLEVEEVEEDERKDEEAVYEDGGKATEKKKSVGLRVLGHNHEDDSSSFSASFSASVPAPRSGNGSPMANERNESSPAFSPSQEFSVSPFSATTTLPPSPLATDPSSPVVTAASCPAAINQVSESPSPPAPVIPYSNSAPHALPRNPIFHLSHLTTPFMDGGPFVGLNPHENVASQPSRMFPPTS